MCGDYDKCTLNPWVLGEIDLPSHIETNRLTQFLGDRYLAFVCEGIGAVWFGRHSYL